MTGPFFLQPGFVNEVYLVGKIVGGASVIVGLIYGAFRWLTSVFIRVRDISTSIVQIKDNHLPHLQTALEDSTRHLVGIQSDVRDLDTKFTGMDTRITETRAAVHTLGESFLRHLESASQERITIQADVARNTVDIAEVAASRKVIETANETAHHMPAPATVVVSVDRSPKPAVKKTIEV